MSKRALVVAALLWVSGCVPMPVVVQANQSGVIVNDVTGKAVGGAKVEVQIWQVLLPSGSRGSLKGAREVATDPEGRFEIPEEREWMVVLFLPDAGVVYNQRLCITKPGFRTRTWDPWSAEKPWNYRFPHEFRLAPLSPAEVSTDCFAGEAAPGSPHPAR